MTKFLISALLTGFLICPHIAFSVVLDVDEYFDIEFRTNISLTNIVYDTVENTNKSNVTFQSFTIRITPQFYVTRNLNLFTDLRLDFSNEFDSVVQRELCISDSFEDCFENSSDRLTNEPVVESAISGFVYKNVLIGAGAVSFDNDVIRIFNDYTQVTFTGFETLSAPNSESKIDLPLGVRAEIQGKYGHLRAISSTNTVNTGAAKDFLKSGAIYSNKAPFSKNADIHLGVIEIESITTNSEEQSFGMSLDNLFLAPERDFSNKLAISYVKNYLGDIYGFSYTLFLRKWLKAEIGSSYFKTSDTTKYLNTNFSSLSYNQRASYLNITLAPHRYWAGFIEIAQKEVGSSDQTVVVIGLNSKL